MDYLLALVAFLLAAFGFNYFKRKSAEALLENNETKSKLNVLDKTKSHAAGLILAEEEKREELQKDAEERKRRPLDPKDFN